MSEEKLKGLKDEAVGKVKETEGKLTDDKVRKTQGKAQGLLGKARKKAADSKEDIEQGAEKLKEKFEKEIASLDNISSKEREQLIQKREFMASYMWNVVGWLADKLGLTIIDMDQKCLPILATDDLESNTLNMTVPKGMVRGMSAVVLAHTKENIEIEAECIGKIYTDEECDKNEWTIQ